MSNPVSYIHGTSLTPLIGETVGANLDRIVGLYPDRDAVVVAIRMCVGRMPSSVRGWTGSRAPW